MGGQLWVCFMVLLWHLIWRAEETKAPSLKGHYDIPDPYLLPSEYKSSLCYCYANTFGHKFLKEDYLSNVDLPVFLLKHIHGF
jgi:hypothetical protein